MALKECIKDAKPGYLERLLTSDFCGIGVGMSFT
jgi:hypothetical protein